MVETLGLRTAIALLGSACALTIGCGRGLRAGVDAEWVHDAGWVQDTVFSDTGAASCAPVATSPCLPGPSEPTSLGLLGDILNVYGLAPAGEQVFVGVAVAPMEAFQGRIVQISLGTREASVFDLPGAMPLEMQVQAGALFYAPSSSDPASSSGYVAPKVTRLDLQTGETRELQNPDGFSSPTIGPLTGNAKAEIFWGLSEGERLAIAKWDPCTRETALLIEGQDVVSLFADASTLFWQAPKDGRASGRIAFWSMPITGGPVSLLLEIAGMSWNGPGLLAIDDEDLYYLVDNDPIRSGILAMPKQGGESRTVIPNAWPLRMDSSTIDDTHIYWTGSEEQETLRRTPKRGGPNESLWSVPIRWIQAVAVDACNVYWVAANPYEVFFRAK